MRFVVTGCLILLRFYLFFSCLLWPTSISRKQEVCNKKVLRKEHVVFSFFIIKNAYFIFFGSRKIDLKGLEYFFLFEDYNYKII